MSYLEMFILVLAVVLFSTISLMQNRTVLRASELVTNASYTLQAMQLAQSTLDEIDAKLFISSLLTFSNIVTTYHNKTKTYSLDYFGATFTTYTTAVSCDAYGSTTATSKPNRLVTVTVTGPAGQRSVVTMRRVYTSLAVAPL